MIADRGLSAASVAIDPVPFRGVLPLPALALTSASPVLRNPLNRGRAIALTNSSTGGPTRSGPAADHRRREGPHLPVGDRQRRYKRQGHNESVTEITPIPNRGRFARPLLAYRST